MTKSRLKTAKIPRFVLYGDALADVELDFLHVETIPRRSSVNDWTIRPHAHPDHHQILIVTKGGGTVQLEDRQHELRPLSLVTVPSLSVHGYRFDPGTDGFSVTVATPFFDVCVEGSDVLRRPFEGPGRCTHVGEDHNRLVEPFRQLDWEFVWAAPGRRTAIKALLQMILVMAARVEPFGEGEDETPGGGRRDAEIVVRYRELVEGTFRRHGSLEELARALGVTPSRLNAACRACVGKSAMGIVHDRIVIEAKRHLLYTGMTVNEIALMLGFEDPAYFNRFFSRRTGVSPGAYRNR